ncbi:MAG TPA: hypothetical protein VNF05_03815 [Acidimicrobiales bacterium]|nr:hypothetical protein [Acidimicrobiales bacterium]
MGKTIRTSYLPGIASPDDPHRGCRGDRHHHPGDLQRGPRGLQRRAGPAQRVQSTRQHPGAGHLGLGVRLGQPRRVIPPGCRLDAKCRAAQVLAQGVWSALTGSAVFLGIAVVVAQVMVRRVK